MLGCYDVICDFQFRAYNECRCACESFRRTQWPFISFIFLLFVFSHQLWVSCMPLREYDDVRYRVASKFGGHRFVRSRSRADVGTRGTTTLRQHMLGFLSCSCHVTAYTTFPPLQLCRGFAVCFCFVFMFFYCYLSVFLIALF